MQRSLVRLTVGLCLTAAALGIAAGTGVGSAGALPLTPGQPQKVHALAQSNQIQISWTAPLNPGTSAVTGYQARALFAGVTTSCVTTTNSCTVTGLKPGASYLFQARAKNSSGYGSFSAPQWTTPGAPFPPTGVTATPGVNSATVSFSPPTVDNASISQYTVKAIPGGKSCVSITSLPCQVTGLTNGTSYTFTATATNPFGTSIASVPSAPVTPQPLPGAPTGASAVAGNSSALVSWTAPAPTGAPVTSYTATSLPGGRTCTAPASATSCTVSGLPNGISFTFTVTATNVIGIGAPSAATAPVTPTAPTVPGVPTGVSATATSVSGIPAAYVNYTAPASNGGSPISGYTVVVVDQTTSTTTDVPGSSSLATVTGLTATDSYTFSVYATNAVGNSAASTPVQAVPQAPTSVTGATNGDGTATISWTPSTVTLGNPVTGFAVSSFDETALALGPSDSVDSATTTTTLSGLTLGDLYDVCVSAQNSLAPLANETCTTFTA